SRSSGKRSVIWSATNRLVIDAGSKWPGGRCPSLAIIVREGNLTGGRSRSQLGGKGAAGLHIRKTYRIGIDHDLRRPWPICPCRRGAAAIGWTVAEIDKQRLEVGLEISDAVR